MGGGGCRNCFHQRPAKHQKVGSCRAGMAWTMAKSRTQGKNGKPNWKTAPSWTGAKNGPKINFRWRFPCFLHFRAIFCPFFAPFQLAAAFHLVFHFFPMSGFLAVFHAMPARLLVVRNRSWKRLNDSGGLEFTVFKMFEKIFEIFEKILKNFRNLRKIFVIFWKFRKFRNLRPPPKVVRSK